MAAITGRIRRYPGNLVSCLAEPKRAWRSGHLAMEDEKVVFGITYGGLGPFVRAANKSTLMAPLSSLPPSLLMDGIRED